MSAGISRWYVVWEGRKPGIYDSWKECSDQVLGFSGNKFKSFATYAEAVSEYAKGNVDAAGESSSPCCQHCDDLRMKVTVMEEKKYVLM